MALTIPALVAQRAAAQANSVVLRKKHRGIWQAVTWAQLGAHVREVVAGLRAVGLQLGDNACVLAETRPEFVYVDLAIQAAGGVSGALDPAIEPDALGDALRQAHCRVLFVENEEQLDKALLVRDRCETLRHIVIFDMKGLRDFADATCESFATFIARNGDSEFADAANSQPAILLLPQGHVLTHGDVTQLIANARASLQPRAGDERMALLPMCSVLERVLGLYLSLDAGAISNYLESPETVAENLQEVQPTLLGADVPFWQQLQSRITTAANGATRLQRGLYRWSISSGSIVARLCVLNAVRRELGLSRLRRAYIGTSLPAETASWANALGIDIQQINAQAAQGTALDEKHRALKEAAYGS